MTDAEIEAVKQGADAPVWGPSDRLLLQTVDQVCNGGRIDEVTWAELAATRDRRWIMDAIHATGYFTSVAWGLVAMGVEVEPDFAAFSQNRAKAG